MKTAYSWSQIAIYNVIVCVYQDWLAIKTTICRPSGVVFLLKIYKCLCKFLFYFTQF